MIEHFSAVLSSLVKPTHHIAATSHTYTRLETSSCFDSLSVVSIQQAPDA